MIGIVISYKPKNSTCRTSINHTLFGRLVYKDIRGKKKAYYTPGILDSIRFSRLLRSKIFIEGENPIEEIYKETLKLFGDIMFIQTERNETDLNLKTAEEHWKKISNEKGFEFHKCRKKK
jgi:hypothetical protein